MSGFSPGFHSNARTWPEIPFCPFCPRYNIKKTAPNQVTCLAPRCKRQQNLKLQKNSYRKKVSK